MNVTVGVRVVGSSSGSPRVDTITDIYIMNMIQSKANVSLLLFPDRGYLNHVIGVSVGSGMRNS